ncbi:MAG: hypothetical protein SPK50_00670 [Mobiluncus porci]|nr:MULTISPECIES: hypothetical protein [Mobiluncus]MDD7542011.1 hypothetical protein [Mobiluncus porci]MDY5747633.1 hypothetical protein [Mobiluncus porci]
MDFLLLVVYTYPKIVVARTKHETTDHEGVQIWDLAKWLLR